MSCTRTALVDAIVSFQGSDGGITPVSEVHDLLTTCHDILDKCYISKWVGNTACILAFVFNSTSRQHCELWASQFPFLYSLKDNVLHSKAWHYICKNWSLAQQQSPFHMLQFSTSMRGGKPNLMPSFGLMCKNSSVSF